MARFSGATVLLILVATVSVYTCAILAGAALGRALENPTTTMTKQPWAQDIALRFRVSFRGLVEDFAKELWGSNHREEGRSGGGNRPGHGYQVYTSVESPPSAARVSQRHMQAKLERQQQYMRVTQAELEYQRCHHMLAQRAATRSRRESSRSDGVYEGGAAAAASTLTVPASSDTVLWRGYHREEGRSGGRDHAGAGDRAAASLPSSSARASVPFSPAELQYRQRQHIGVTEAELEYHRCHYMLAQRAATRSRRESGRSDGEYEGRAATVVPVSSDTELWRGYHMEEGRSGGRAHAGAGDRAAAAAAEALPSSAARSSVPLSPAELQDRQRQIMIQEIESGRMQMIRGVMKTTEQQTARPLSRHSNFYSEITEGTWQGGVVKVGPWGGSQGQPFYMGSGATAPRLLSVTLYHADAIHDFSFEYLVNGLKRTNKPFGRRFHSSKGVRATINFSTGEHLTAVEGTFGHCTSVPEVVVTSLTFRTNKGNTYGPYGEETGTPFSVPAANGCIVGFWGRSGWLIDAIGVYIMPCQVNEPTSSVTNAYKAAS